MAADVAGDRSGLDVLAADVAAGEAEVEGVERSPGGPGRDRGDDRRVDAAADERAQRHVGDQHRRHRPRQLAIESVDDVGQRPAMLGHVRRQPVAAARQGAVAHRQPVARQQLADVGVDAARGRDVLALEVERQRVGVDPPRQAGERQQRLQLRAEHQRPPVPSVVERLHAQVVAGNEELPLRLVPQREREHPGEPGQHAFAPLSPAQQDRLAVAVGREPVPGRLELAPQLAEVVDLAVEHQRKRTVGADERLPAAGEVDHRQAPMTEADRSVEVEAVGIRAAVGERRRHRRQRGAGLGYGGVVAGDAAHGGELVDGPVAWPRSRCRGLVRSSAADVPGGRARRACRTDDYSPRRPPAGSSAS